MPLSSLKIGDPAPEFCLPDEIEDEVCLKDLKGKWVVLYFYPKDNTPGCTIEATKFTAKKAEYDNEGAVILGISKDSCKSHVRFIERMGLTITLLSDPEHKTIEEYGAWKPKKFMGREFLGVLRTTYLIDPEGSIAYIWPEVKVTKHVEEVMAKIVEIKANVG